MAEDKLKYERTNNYGIESQGVIVTLELGGLVETAVRVASGTAIDFALDVSNSGDFNGEEWTIKTWSSVDDIDYLAEIPERYVQLRNTSTSLNTGEAGEADAEITSAAGE